MELVVNLLAVGRREALLVLVVAVAEVVALAGLEEGVTPRVVRRVVAAVGGPGQPRRVLGVAVLDEAAQRGAEQEVVSATTLDGGGLALEEGPVRTGIVRDERSIRGRSRGGKGSS